VHEEDCFPALEAGLPVSVGGGLVEANVPTMTAVLQKKRTGENTGAGFFFLSIKYWRR
jgi:hypothetical protein